MPRSNCSSDTISFVAFNFVTVNGGVELAKILFHRIFHRYRGWLWAEGESFQGDDTELLLQVIAAVNARVKILPTVFRRKKKYGVFINCRSESGSLSVWSLSVTALAGSSCKPH